MANHNCSNCQLFIDQQRENTALRERIALLEGRMEELQLLVRSFGERVLTLPPPQKVRPASQAVGRTAGTKGASA